MKTPKLPHNEGMSHPARKRHGKASFEGGTKTDSTDPSFLYCAHEAYPKVMPGTYELYCTEARSYLDPGMKTWKCRYRFIDPLREDSPALFGFINLSKDCSPPGRRSRYFHEWTIAVGQLPRKRQVMSDRVFRGKLFRVRVDWVSPRQHNCKTHTDATRYSLVKEILALACSGTARSYQA